MTTSIAGAKEETGRASGKGLLVACLLGPAAWLLHFNLSYALVYPACEHGGNETTLWIVTLASLAVAVLGAAHAARGWSRIGGPSPLQTGLQEVEGLRILALVAFACCLGAAVLILGNAVPIALLHACD